MTLSTTNKTPELISTSPYRVKSTQIGSSARVGIPTVSQPFTDILCFAHLRWNFVYQRPQHLLSRAAHQCRVWYIEEPVWQETLALDIRKVDENLTVVVPHLPRGINEPTAIRLQRQLVNQLIDQQDITDYITWYYTPMSLQFTDHLRPKLVLYDCMDELSAFLGAPPQLIEQEQLLLNRAEVVFTGGYSLYDAKKERHANVYAFPSCIDYTHFYPANSTNSLTGLDDPADQAAIGYPRIGYSGVIDERLDLSLLGELAKRQPDWQFVLLGPVVKIDPATLPTGPNLHYLGMKDYQALPAYFSNWQMAMMPFAINKSTQFISPTKTPEYLAAGLPVVSTPIRDVVRTYEKWSRVTIADTVPAFEQGILASLHQSVGNDEPELDQFLRTQSWDQTWRQMHGILVKQISPVRLSQ